MNKKIANTLTIEELQQVVECYAKLISILEGKSPTETLKKELSGILLSLPSTIITYGEKGRGKFATYDIVKQVGGVVYSQDGYTRSYFNSFFMQPWKPEPDIFREYEEKVSEAEEQYSNKPTTKELAEEDAKSLEKRFQTMLNRRNNLCLKYQITKYLGQTFKVPKRFKFQGKWFWEIGKELTEKMFAAEYSEKSIKNLERTFQKVFHEENIDQLLNRNGRFSIDLPYFRDENDIEKTLKIHKLVEETRGQYGWIESKKIYDEYYLSIKTVMHKNYEILSHGYSVINHIVDLYTTLATRKESIPEPIRELFLEIGLLEPEQEEDSSADNV